MTRRDHEQRPTRDRSMFGFRLRRLDLLHDGATFLRRRGLEHERIGGTGSTPPTPAWTSTTHRGTDVWLWRSNWTTCRGCDGTGEFEDGSTCTGCDGAGGRLR